MFLKPYLDNNENRSTDSSSESLSDISNNSKINIGPVKSTQTKTQLPAPKESISNHPNYTDEMIQFIISSIQLFPAIYNKSDNGYKEKSKKKNIFKMISDAIFLNFKKQISGKFSYLVMDI